MKSISSVSLNGARMIRLAVRPADCACSRQPGIVGRSSRVLEGDDDRAEQSGSTYEAVKGMVTVEAGTSGDGE